MTAGLTSSKMMALMMMRMMIPTRRIPGGMIASPHRGIGSWKLSDVLIHTVNNNNNNNIKEALIRELQEPHDININTSYGELSRIFNLEGVQILTQVIVLFSSAIIYNGVID